VLPCALQLPSLGSHDSLGGVDFARDHFEVYDVQIPEMPSLALGCNFCSLEVSHLVGHSVCNNWAQLLTRGDMAHTPLFVKGMVPFPHTFYVIIPVQAWAPLALAPRRIIKP